MPYITEITDLEDPALHIYARLSERELLHYYEPGTGLFVAESPRVIERALDAGYVPVSLLLERKHVEGQAKEIIARCGDIPVYTASLEILTRLTGFSLTRGALCAMRRNPLPAVEEVCAGKRRIVVMEHVMNPANTGAIFRSAAALGMDSVLLTSSCSDPLYRRAIRVSMGTVFQIPWTYFDEKTCPWPNPGMDCLKRMGFKTVAMALCEDSVSIDDPKLMSEEKLAIVLGTEGEGLERETIAACDYTVRIPMYHGVDSLNVAAASAVAFWQLGIRG